MIASMNEHVNRGKPKDRMNLAGKCPLRPHEIGQKTQGAHHLDRDPVINEQ